MNKFTLSSALLLATTTMSANATLLNFTGDIANHNDVVYTQFTLDDDSNNVRVWTDSHQGGINFDPITALWNSDGDLIREDDDNASVNPSTQTSYDSGFALNFLAAGTYTFTVATYNNFATGGNLSDGFSFDSEAPIALSEWSQPASSLNMGTHWSVWLDGVDSATSTPVPAPASIALFGLALAGLGFSRKSKKS
ncbi:PEP-CTERM sorting domain-containing protein [Psychromonas sp. psych-6C06]|uniref:DVUA0089 family protein n=1 Tax=Psychromonas sp. psych-6C06 TaxID=2058089 RepID=UPI000C34A4A1|nr:DVUA0089 family protein [Psychromonas sp. psych-6C06]PKF61548.1 PEP-CTERM sorting domain-containing protein [Psychromonas sp. psych-6C06]